MAILEEIGATGLSSFSGQIQADFLKELRGREAYKRYNEMRLNSPVVGALLLAIEQSVRAVSWQYTSELGPDDPRLELVAAAEANLRHSWNDHVSEALTFLPFGFSVFEIVYENVSGDLLWRKFAARGQDTVLRWLFDDTGGLSGFVQQAAPVYKTVEIPIERLLIYRTRVERNNPEGRSILRTAWISYYFQKHIAQIEAIGIERDLTGLPVIIMPEGADTTESTSDTTDYGRAIKIVRNLRNDEQAGVVLPHGWELKLLSTGGSRQFDIDKTLTRYESRILMSALAQFLLLGQQNVGSLALSRDQTDFFTMSVNTVADVIGAAFTKFAIPRLLRLNGYDPDGIVLEHSPAGDVDVKGLAELLGKVGGFITWGPAEEVWLRQVLRLPEKTVEELQDAADEKQANPIAPQGVSVVSSPEAGTQTAPMLEKMRAQFTAALAKFESALSGKHL